MNRKMSIWVLVLGAVVMLAAVPAEAVNPDSCLISVSPPSTYGVKIDTPTGGVDFGSVSLNTVYISSAAGVGISTVTNSGSVVNDWRIQGANVSGGWTLVSKSGNTKDTVAQDELNLCVVLTSTDTSSVTDANFDDLDILDTNQYDIDSTTCTVNGSGYDGNNLPAGGMRRMWFRIHTPNQTTVETQQTFRATIEAVANSSF